MAWLVELYSTAIIFAGENGTDRGLGLRLVGCTAVILEWIHVGYLVCLCRCVSWKGARETDIGEIGQDSG